MYRKEKEILFLDKNDCVYTSCYCEENVWKMCDQIKKTHPDKVKNCYGVFISNDNRTIPLWFQKSNQQDGAVVWVFVTDNESKDCWLVGSNSTGVCFQDIHPSFRSSEDYHVLLIYKDDTECLVYDLDTTLPFPCEFKQYAVNAIRDELLKKSYHRYFRVIPAEEFLTTFASDRSHMRNEDGSWKMEPPSYPCITSKSSSNNIQEFISMDKDTNHGTVLDLKELLQEFHV